MAKLPELENFLNNISMRMFGMTIAEAQAKNICIDCKSTIRHENGAEPSGEYGQIYSDAGEREYRTSALCETCYDNVMGDN